MGTLFVSKEEKIRKANVRKYFCLECNYDFKMVSPWMHPRFCPNCGVRFDNFRPDGTLAAS